MQDTEIKPIGAAAFWLPGALTAQAPALLAEIERIARQSPFRKMATRRGFMSVAMTNCGEFGWVSDTRAYHYSRTDPLNGKLWPAMPHWLFQLAVQAAARVGFAGFAPNACLINQYQEDSTLGLHADQDEGDWQSPIVSFSLGAPAVFRWGGRKASSPVQNIVLQHGDILVWGGEDRLRYHGISKVYVPDITGGFYQRYVMTFRHSKCWRPH